MINLTLNIQNVSELAACLDLLKDRGLLSALTNDIKTKEAAIPRATQKPGDHFKKMSEAKAQRLQELGLTSVPKATETELILREEIDNERKTNGEGGVLWKVDLVTRERVLLERGYNIFDVPAEEVTEGTSNTNTGYDIDLNDAVV